MFHLKSPSFFPNGSLSRNLNFKRERIGWRRWQNGPSQHVGINSHLVIYLFDSFYNRNFQIPLCSLFFFTIPSQKCLQPFVAEQKLPDDFTRVPMKKKEKYPPSSDDFYIPRLHWCLFYLLFFPPKSGQTTRLFVDIFLDYSFVDWAI